MSEIFGDIYTILFLVLAIVIFLRLRSVLGRRTGNERPPFDPLAKKSASDGDKEAAEAESANDNVVELPQRARRGRDESEPVDWTKYTKKNSGAEKGLEAIASAEPAFNIDQFVGGARAAYEMIIMAYANGDTRTLRGLLSKDVYEGFAGAIAERDKAGESVDTTFIGIDRAPIVEAVLKGKTAEITFEFESQLITTTKDKAGEIIDGDPQTIETIIDVWTFARDVGARDPNWSLVATESPE